PKDAADVMSRSEPHERRKPASKARRLVPQKAVTIQKLHRPKPSPTKTLVQTPAAKPALSSSPRSDQLPTSDTSLLIKHRLPIADPTRPLNNGRCKAGAIIHPTPKNVWHPLS
ncbi:MAG: hypothetical protein M0R31_05275, partial [Candidatus Riflebacteria bacterium]|nr:hypothetical protein [Candidatus Riflebacteria bacterium]